MSKNYHAYLLRIWQVDDPQNPAWRASLEDPHTRKVISFGNLERLNEFLLNLTGVQAEEDGKQAFFPPD
jgi:hypothetical protein